MADTKPTTATILDRSVWIFIGQGKIGYITGEKLLLAQLILHLPSGMLKRSPSKGLMFKKTERKCIEAYINFD